jgi:hypothetical protein
VRALHGNDALVRAGEERGLWRTEILLPVDVGRASSGSRM